MSKIISFADYKAQKEAEHMTVKCDAKGVEAAESFEKIAKRNKLKADRVAKERAEACRKLKRQLRLGDL